MIRTQVYLSDDQARDIKLQAKREHKKEAEVIRELVDKGLGVTRNAAQETAGEALLRLAALGERLHVKGPADLSSRIDDYLYGEQE